MFVVYALFLSETARLFDKVTVLFCIPIGTVWVPVALQPRQPL